MFWSGSVKQGSSFRRLCLHQHSEHLAVSQALAHVSHADNSFIKPSSEHLNNDHIQRLYMVTIYSLERSSMSHVAPGLCQSVLAQTLAGSLMQWYLGPQVGIQHVRMEPVPPPARLTSPAHTPKMT